MRWLRPRWRTPAELSLRDMQLAHPLADEWTDEYLVYFASSKRVLVTEPVESFLSYARSEGLRPIIVTEADASLSSFLAFAMRDAGGFWAIKDSSGVYNALSGYRINSFDELWSGNPEGEIYPALRTRRPDPVGALMFDIYNHQRAVTETMVGGVMRETVRLLGGAPLQVWGRHEPLTSAWDEQRITAAARAEMPLSGAVRARGTTGAYAEMSVGRTKQGLLEHIRGGVPIGAYPSDNTAPVLQTASEALAALVERFRPTVGFVSLAEVDPDLNQGAQAKLPEVPLAMLIGPKAVHDLGVDIAAVTKRHDVIVLGRPRTPSLLVRFSDEYAGMWAQLLGFAYDLGLDRIESALGFDLPR